MEELLRKLIEIPSVTGRSEPIGEALEYVDRFLSERGMFVRRLEYDGVESIVATTRNHKKPKVFLAAHIDVVHGSEDQFTLRVENGRYYGRGVADMKFALAVYLQLVDELRSELQEYDFGLMITSDEEVGGFSGTGKLVRDGYVADVVILPDAGDSPDNWKLERSAKGKLAVKLAANGWSAHGSRPWQGENAIDKLTDALVEIRGLFNGQGPHTDTLTVSTIRGGSSYNQVPARAEAELDIRTKDNTATQAMQKRISAVCKKHGIEWSHAHPPFSASVADLSSPYFKLFTSLVREVVTNYKLIEADSYGSSDARFFADVDVPCIVVTPPAEGYHALDEWIAADGLTQLKDVIKLFLDRTARNGQIADAAARAANKTLKAA